MPHLTGCAVALDWADVHGYHRHGDLCTGEPAHSAFARAAISGDNLLRGLYAEHSPGKMLLAFIMRNWTGASYADWIPHNH